MYPEKEPEEADLFSEDEDVGEFLTKASVLEVFICKIELAVPEEALFSDQPREDIEHRIVGVCASLKCARNPRNHGLDPLIVEAPEVAINGPKFASSTKADSLPDEVLDQPADDDSTRRFCRKMSLDLSELKGSQVLVKVSDAFFFQTLKLTHDRSPNSKTLDRHTVPMQNEP